MSPHFKTPKRAAFEEEMNSDLLERVIGIAGAAPSPKAAISTASRRAISPGLQGPWWRGWHPDAAEQVSISAYARNGHLIEKRSIN